MNHRAFPPNFVTQNSDESDEEINPRCLNRSRIAANIRRNSITNNHMNTIPDDIDPVILSPTILQIKTHLCLQHLNQLHPVIQVQVGCQQGRFALMLIE